MMRDRLGRLAACLFTAGMVVLGTGAPASAKGRTTLTVEKATVAVGDVLHFRGESNSDGGVAGDGICLFEVKGWDRYEQLAPCVTVQLVDGNTQEGRFAIDVKTSLFGQFDMVVIPEHEGLINTADGVL